MKTRLQTILETVENLMEYYAPDHIYKFDRSKIPVYDYISRQPVQRRPRVPSETDKPPYPRLPPSIRPGAGDGFDKVPYTPQRPGSNSGSVGAGNSVSGYDSRPKTGGLLGAGSSVSGYDSGSDAPTPQPPSNKPPYPRLPPSKRPGSPDNPFSKIPGGYDGFGKPKSPKGDDNYGPFQGKDSWRDRDEWVVDKEIQTYPPKYVYRRKTDADRIGDRFGSINRFRSIM